MVNIYSFSQMNEVAPLMDAKTFDYISECEVESFESFDDFVFCLCHDVSPVVMNYFF